MLHFTFLKISAWLIMYIVYLTDHINSSHDSLHRIEVVGRKKHLYWSANKLFVDMGISYILRGSKKTLNRTSGEKDIWTSFY